MGKLLTTLRATVGIGDILILGGAGSFLYGLAQISPPIAWMAAGIALIAIGARR